MVERIDVSQLEVRDSVIDGQGPWVWPKMDGIPGSDGGAWVGPKDDWEQHHKNNVLKYVKKFDTVVQAGGACGMYPRLYAQMFGRVYTFEPDHLNFYCLNLNCTEKNVIKFQAALIHDHQMLGVTENVVTNVGMHTVHSDQENGLIPGLRVDDFNLPSLDLIHLDVEGCELYALYGAANSINKFKPVLILERGTSKQITDFLEQFGYKIRGSSGYADVIWTVD